MILRAALLLSLLCAGARADIDVSIPPGLASEWTRLLPRPVVTDLGQVPHPRSKTGKRGSVSSLPAQPGARFEGGVDSSFGFSGILTVDLPVHFPWSLSRIGGDDKHQSLTGRAARSEGWRYPPPFPMHLYWLSIAAMLRYSVHPAMVSRAATVEYLVTLGEPAYLAATSSRGEGALRWVSKQLETRVGPFPERAPTPRGGTNAYQKLIHRLATVELASGYPYSPARRFARRLLSLGREGFGPVVSCTRHPNRFVKRNAVAALARYDGKATIARLRELLTDRDGVVRNRALQAVAERKDVASVPWLLKSLRSRDRGLQVLAATALGRIGDARAAGPLVRLLESGASDHDLLWAVLPALARLGSRDAAQTRKALRLLSELAKKLAENRFLFGNVDPAYAPPVRDKQTRADVIGEMCLIARAGLGDADARRALLAQLASRRGRARKKVVKLNLRGNLVRVRGNLLRGVWPPNLFVLCDVLARMGKTGNQLLLEVVEDRTEEAAVRAYALQALDPSQVLTFLEALQKMARIARTSDVGLVRARALQQLVARDMETALETARRIVIEYSIGTPDYDAVSREWVVIPAMQLLGRKGVTQLPVLLQVAARAATEAEEGLLRRKKARPKVKQRSGQVPLYTVPPMLEAALVEIGRIGSKKALGPLLERLAATDELGRAEAALALGAIGGKKAAAGLLGALDDDDPWVRFCAYRGLRRMSDVDYFCDWIFARSAPTRAETIRKWKIWFRREYPS